jgi:CRP-like cAMP-binding protein
MNAQPLIEYILQFGSLNKQQIDLIHSSLAYKTYKMGDYFLKVGKVCREIGFITQGVFRVCYYDNDGNEVTRYFLEEGSFMADLNSFNTGVPTTEYVQAVTGCEVIMLRKQAMENLSQTILIWDRMIGKITAKALAQKVSRVSLMMPQDALTRYEFFLEQFPGLANRVPLQFIASYLGITRSSLSRLRKERGNKP